MKETFNMVDFCPYTSTASTSCIADFQLIKYFICILNLYSTYFFLS